MTFAWNPITSKLDLTGSGGGGTVPPEALLSITTDSEEADIPIIPGSGTSVSSDNNYILTGDNGIEIVTDSNNRKVNQVRFSRAYTTTTNDTPTNLLTLPVPDDTTLTFQVLISCRSSAGSGGGYLTATVENTAGTATRVDESDFIINNSAGLEGIDIQASVSGGNFVIEVTGLDSTNIKWGVCLPGMIITD